MKVHPGIEGNGLKRLKKLPHVFNKVLELPLRSDADVTVEEGPNFFRFIADIEVHRNETITTNVSVHPLEIHPGVIKIIVRHHDKPGEIDTEFSLDKLDFDTWRFRLPSSSQPELAHAVFEGRKIVVTVPKGKGIGRSLSEGETWGASSQIVLVQQFSSVLKDFVSQLHGSRFSF